MMSHLIINLKNDRRFTGLVFPLIGFMEQSESIRQSDYAATIFFRSQ
jgi:hypothetical protein